MKMLLRLQEMLLFLVFTLLLLKTATALEDDAEATVANNTSTASLARKSRQEEDDAHLPEPSALVSPQSSKIAGLFGGKPFFLEKDPITGVVDFNTKTVRINSSGDRISDGEEYYNESETASSVAPQSDHKDTNTDPETKPSNIIPYKNFPGNLNDFTNLRVHDYSNHKYHNDKFPLISSSYANTKVQGTAGTNKNHRPLPTSSTPHPSYYTMNKVTSPTRATEPTTQLTSTTSSTTTSTTTTTTTTTPLPAASYEEYDEFYEDSQEQTEQPLSGAGHDFSVHYGGFQNPPGTEFSSAEKPYWINSAKPKIPESQTSSPGKPSVDVNIGLPNDPNKSSQTSVSYGTNHDQVQIYAQSPLLPKEKPPHKNFSFPQNHPDRTSPDQQAVIINSTRLHNIPSPNLQFDQHFTENTESSSNTSHYNTNPNNINGLHNWNVGVSDKHESTSDFSKNPSDSYYDESEFAEEEVEYQEEDVHNSESQPITQKPTKQEHSPTLVSSEPPFRFTTSTPLYRHTTSVRTTQQTLPQRVTKITTTAQPPTSSPLPSSSNIVTSMPLGTHFHFKPPPQQVTLPRQPEVAGFQTPLNQNQNIHHTTVKSIATQHSSGYLQNLSTNVVVGAGIHQIGSAGSNHETQSHPTGGHFVSTALKARPYDGNADEPFKPILGPFDKTETIHNINLNGDANIVVGSGIGVGSGGQFVSHELPPRPNYPTADGSSSILKFPTRVIEKHQPPRIHGMEPPRAEPSLVFESSPVSGGHVVFPEDKPNLSATNELVTSQTDVIYDKSTPPYDRLVNEDILPPRVTNQPGSTQNKPLPGRDTIQTPSPYLVPPAKPEILPPNPNWDTRPKLPPSSQNYYPQPNQKARPKIDTVMPNSNISPNRIVRPNQNGGRRPGIQNNLPNILPQFRPNAKNSHGQVEHGLRVHQFMQQRPPIMGQRHPVGLVESLQPPPPPPHIRINRNDEAVTEDSAQELLPFDNIPPTPPVMQRRPLLVHRRTGPHTSSLGSGRPQVSTLQMMQSRPLSRRDDFPEAQHDFAPPMAKFHSLPPRNEEEPNDHPVFVVYPVNSAPVNIRGSSDSSGVVVGTRGPQLPLPPSNLEKEYNLPTGVDDVEDSSSVALTFAHHRDQEPLLQLSKEKHDTPVLKSPTKLNHNVPTAHIKPEFPYPLEKPNVFMTNGEVKRNSEQTRPQNLNHDENLSEHKENLDENTPEETFQAEVYNSNVDEEEDNTDMNVIPYLQDYMPYATKKPYSSEKSTDREQYIYGNRSNGWTLIDKTDEARIVNVPHSNKELLQSASPISVTLKTIHSASTPASSTTTVRSSGPFRITDNPRPIASPPSHHHAVVGAGGSEFTLSAVVHTQPHENHRPADAKPPSVSSVTSPPPLNFQAPFLASANIGAAPTNQGWSVVGASSNEAPRPGIVDRADLDSEESSISSASTEGVRDKESTNFDIENFKPQLFGGFKPIYTYPEDDGSVSPSLSTSEKVQAAEREEKKLHSVFT